MSWARWNDLINLQPFLFTPFLLFFHFCGSFKCELGRDIKHNYVGGISSFQWLCRQIIRASNFNSLSWENKLRQFCYLKIFFVIKLQAAAAVVSLITAMKLISLWLIVTSPFVTATNDQLVKLIWETNFDNIESTRDALNVFNRLYHALRLF